jgi:hypothetical protein
VTLTQQLTDYVRAAFAGLWVQTHEPDEAEREIAELCNQHQWLMKSWDCAQGIKGQGGDTANQLAPLALKAPANGTLIVVLHNYHKFITNPVVMQRLFNAVLDGKQSRTFFAVLSHQSIIPPELEKVFVVIEHELPDEPALNSIAVDLCEGGVLSGCSASVRAAAGLTRYEAEGSFALSIARSGLIAPETVWELKQSMLKKSGLLEMHRGKESFADLGGLDQLKQFCAKAVNHSNGVRAKGVMLLGVPGTGKSHFARALGGETGRPTLLMDVGGFYGSLVGQTEERIRQALRIADAMSPCILFIDEIEKALAGVGGQGDSGVATRLFGTLLTWLSDHTSDVFVVATSNDVSKLPPEFTRAERWDAVFFLDLPEDSDRTKIWRLYKDHYQLADARFPMGTNPHRIDDDNWTGAEIKSCCRLAALLDIGVYDATQYVIPVAVTAADKVQSLREWASGRCLSASQPGIYRHDQPSSRPTNNRRTIARKAST